VALSLGKKQALGICTIVNFVLSSVAGLVVFITFARMFSVADATNEPPMLPSALIVGVVIVMATSMLHMALIAIYVYLVTKLDVDSTQRVIWILVVVFGGVIGQAVLFFLKIWPEPTVSVPGASPTGRPVTQPTQVTGWPTGQV
jgi:hypothetical protein